MVASKDVCPSSEALLSYVGRTIDVVRQAEMERHIDECADCRLVVAELVRDLAPEASDPTPENADALTRGMRLGRYLIVAKLGSGGMGTVYTAYDPELDRKIALKLLRPDKALADPEAKVRLAREAQAMARLSDPNVVAVHDVGAVGEMVYIAMELVEGSTLRAWLADKKRTRAEIVDVFLEAGRGLAAAHRRGLVHRDFKPDNVLVGRDGRVRVTDFGLAYATHDTIGLDALADRAVEEITRTGTILGTPAYMAPEQLRSAQVSARSDQFSFCVALHEALCGERPFVASSVHGLIELHAARRGDPPASRRLPAWLRRAIGRGLSHDPDERWPSIEALLERIERGVLGARRRWITAAAALVVVGLGAVIVARTPPQAAGAVCGTARLDGVWDASRKLEIERAFAATGRPYASDAWHAVERALDRYIASYVAARRDACEATRVRHEQSEKAMDVRAACLDRRLGPLRALSDLFVHADGDAVLHAADEIAALAPISGCADVAALAGITPPPDDPAIVTTIGRLRRRLDELGVMMVAGRFKEAHEGLELIVPAARLCGYPPVLGDTLLRLGNSRMFTGDSDGARAALIEAAAVADEARDDELREHALFHLAEVARLHADHRAVQEYLRQADGVLERLGYPADAQVGALRLRAGVLDDMGEYVAARPLAERARDLAERAFGVESSGYADTTVQLAYNSYHLGKLAESAREFKRALEIEQRIRGEASPYTSDAVHGLGMVALAGDDFQAALEYAQTEVRLLDDPARTYGDAQVALALRNLADSQLTLGRIDEATTTLRRVLEVTRRSEKSDNLVVADVMGELCGALLEAEALPEAEGLARNALAIYQRLNPAHPAIAHFDSTLSLILARQGRLAEAVALAAEGVALGKERLGDAGNTLAAYLWATQGEVLRLAHRPHDALESFRKAIALDREFNEQSVEQAEDLSSLGEALLDDRDAADAAAALEEAIAVLLHRPSPPDDLPTAKFLLARALRDRPGAADADRLRARTLAQEARAGMAAVEHPRIKPDEIDRWLAARETPR